MVIFHRFLGLFTRGYHQNGAAHGGDNLGQSQDFPPWNPLESHSKNGDDWMVQMAIKMALFLAIMKSSEQNFVDFRWILDEKIRRSAEGCWGHLRGATFCHSMGKSGILGGHFSISITIYDNFLGTGIHQSLDSNIYQSCFFKSTKLGVGGWFAQSKMGASATNMEYN